MTPRIALIVSPDCVGITSRALEQFHRPWETAALCAPQVQIALAGLMSACTCRLAPNPKGGDRYTSGLSPYRVLYSLVYGALPPVVRRLKESPSNTNVKSIPCKLFTIRPPNLHSVKAT